MHIDLSPAELEALATLLHEHCRELRFEISHTDHRDYKLSLEHRLEVFQGVLQRVRDAAGLPVREVA
jgi:hypothetical protein